MFSINPLKFFRRTEAVVTEAYRGASKMGKGKKLKSSSVTADFEKFENFFYQDSHVFGIITCIADSMSKSGRHEGLKNPMILNYFLDGFFKDGSIRKEILIPSSRLSRLFTYP